MNTPRLIFSIFPLVLLTACSDPAALSSARTTAPLVSSTLQTGPTIRGRLLVPTDYSPDYQMLASGTLVPSADLFQVTEGQGQEVFADHLRGYALAFVHSQTYPVTTVDGGTTWRIDGPILYVAAADGGSFVNEINAPTPQTVLVWGPGSTDIVDVTTDGGVEWWTAHLGPGVLGMGEMDTEELWAVVANSNEEFLLSKDGGRTWEPSDGRSGRG